MTHSESELDESRAAPQKHLGSKARVEMTAYCNVGKVFPILIMNFCGNLIHASLTHLLFTTTLGINIIPFLQ